MLNAIAVTVNVCVDAGTSVLIIEKTFDKQILKNEKQFKVPVSEHSNNFLQLYNLLCTTVKLVPSLPKNLPKTNIF